MIKRWVGNIPDFIRETGFSCALATFLVLALKGSRLAIVFGLVSLVVGAAALISKVRVSPESTLVAKVLSDLKALWRAALRDDADEVKRRTKALDYERDQLRNEEGVVLELKVGIPVVPLIIGAGFGILLWFLI